MRELRQEKYLPALGKYIAFMSRLSFFTRIVCLKCVSEFLICSSLNYLEGEPLCDDKVTLL